MLGLFAVLFTSATGSELDDLQKRHDPKNALLLKLGLQKENEGGAMEKKKMMMMMMMEKNMMMMMMMMMMHLLMMDGW